MTRAILEVSPDAAGSPYTVDKHKGVKDGAMVQGRGLSEEEESNINEMATNELRNEENGDFWSTGQQAGVQSQQQQQHQPGPTICWERFLPVRTLKVLLVENDDSTRHVVSALLRNCGYEVTATANGLQAWKILEDLNNDIDLVLSEVFMPCLPGIGLLDKIMSHKTCKNIPVIMMSSNDSMGTVFKSLSKGAVDFLAKPVRKNELKNLWQHVWRRCRSSSVSGNESAIQTLKSVKPYNAHDSENNSDSNDDDNGTSGLDARDGSDNGSGTQSLWTKHALDVESLQHDQLAYPPDSTRALFIDPKSESLDWVRANGNKDHREQELADDLMGKDLVIGIPETQDIRSEFYPCKTANKTLGGQKALETDQDNESDGGLKCNNPYDEPSTLAIDLIGAIAKGPDPQTVHRVIQGLKCFTNIQGGIDKTAENNLDLPSLELGLKRLRSVGKNGASILDERNILKHSDQSAFKRYHTSVASSQTANGYGVTSSPIENDSDAIRIESACNVVSGSSMIPLKQGSNKSRKLNNLGSSTKMTFTNPTLYNEKTTPTSGGKSARISSAFHPMQFGASKIQQNVQEKGQDMTSATVIGQSRVIQQQVQVRHHHHHYHHSHLHVHGMQEQQQPQPLPLPDCGSSNIFAEPIEAGSPNYSVNGSNSGSNHGSIGHNGNSTAANVGESNMDIDNGLTNHVLVLGGGNGSGPGVEQQQFSHREAALKKFRQKRKERNFGKQVRYQSRKRLAENRPRVRGQFVRQNLHEGKAQKQINVTKS